MASVYLNSSQAVYKNQRRADFIWCGLLFLIAVYIFWNWVGWSVLNPAKIDWMYFGDYRQNFSAINLFRHSDWSFPIGHVGLTDYPVGSNIVFMDGNLLLAIISKLLGEILGPVSQIYGFWILGCLVFQLLSVYWVLRQCGVSGFCSFAGGLLIGMAPVFFFRVFHLNLLPHFVIIAGWGAVFSSGLSANKRLYIFQALILFSVLTHFYFVPPLFVMGVLAQWRSYSDLSWNQKVLRVIERGLVLLLITTMVMYVAGYFQNFRGNGEGFGFYSMNLNAPVNPMGTSRYVVSLPVGTEGQYEGYQYLGLGVLLFLVAVFIVMGRGALNNVSKGVKAFWISILIFSLSNMVYLGSGLVFGLHLPEMLMKIVSPFRSSGRYAWFVLYGVLIAVYLNAYNLSGRLVGREGKYPLFFGAFVLFLSIIQYQDILPIVRGKKLDVSTATQSQPVRVASLVAAYIESTGFIGPVFIDIPEPGRNKDVFAPLSKELKGQLFSISPSPDVRENLNYSGRDHVKDTLDAGGLIVSESCDRAVAPVRIDLMPGWCLFRR